MHEQMHHTKQSGKQHGAEGNYEVVERCKVSNIEKQRISCSKAHCRASDGVEQETTPIGSMNGIVYLDDG